MFWRVQEEHAHLQISNPNLPHEFNLVDDNIVGFVRAWQEHAHNLGRPKPAPLPVEQGRCANHNLRSAEHFSWDEAAVPCDNPWLDVLKGDGVAAILEKGLAFLFNWALFKREQADGLMMALQFQKADISRSTHGWDRPGAF